MEFNVRAIVQEDYENILVKWWKDWGWTPPPEDFLPETGLIVHKDGVDICAGFIYLTNSKVALTEFVVSNKEYRESDRSDALQFLLDCILLLAADNGCKYAHVILKNKSLLKKYKESGYIVSDDNVTEMIKVWQ
jgi:hypothetical protein